MAGMRTLQAATWSTRSGSATTRCERWQGAETALGTQVITNQVQYSLVFPRPRGATCCPTPHEAGRVLAYSPLAQGLLSGKFDAEHRPANRVRSLNPLFLPESLRRAPR